jgi:putative ABC transport system ATP-binding protein
MLDLIYTTVQYGNTRALNETNMHVDEGEFVAVNGPSGSGKTTLLHVLGGLLRPSDGYCLVNNKELYAMSDGERTAFRLMTIGLVFQRFNLIHYLSARENVELAFYLQGLAHPEQVSRAGALLDQLGLNSRADNRPAALSVGEQQRVAVARAVATGAPILLADEPTGNLDPESATAVMELIARERKERGLTVLLVTHQPRIAERADRSIRLVAGRFFGQTVKRRETATSAIGLTGEN